MSKRTVACLASALAAILSGVVLAWLSDPPSWAVTLFIYQVYQTMRIRDVVREVAEDARSAK